MRLQNEAFAKDVARPRDEVHPQGAIIHLSRRVFHPRALNQTIVH
jgi:hypothetical protein